MKITLKKLKWIPNITIKMLLFMITKIVNKVTNLAVNIEEKQHKRFTNFNTKGGKKYNSRQ